MPDEVSRKMMLEITVQLVFYTNGRRVDSRRIAIGPFDPTEERALSRERIDEAVARLLTEEAARPKRRRLSKREQAAAASPPPPPPPPVQQDLPLSHKPPTLEEPKDETA